MKIGTFQSAEDLAAALNLTRPFVAADVETTGKNPTTARIVQLAALKIWPDGHVAEINLLFNPGEDIPPGATEIHKITNLDVVHAIPFKTVAAELADFLEGDFCGYNARYDATVLAEEFIRAGVKWKHGELIDPFRVFTMMETRSLTDAVRFYLGEDMINAHDAVFDIRATVRVLLAQLKRYPDLPQTVDGLAQLFKDQDTSSKIDADGRLLFGGPKGHKGKLLSEVPADYLSWIMSADFTPGVKKLVDTEMKRRTKP